ncbi:MAG: hypothetical protein HOE19_04200 [Candidatus Komeilibacteria bacterium]|jgi:phosphopantothenoylcysteine decarboxylase / phosphopantothenate---cysteine ligase|nr:hypothetical protein [Candidatus Komeilibacteria bacterium]MBT4447876.1 hypothetical protein [Candidatus Komeilibacteria bacterium]
MKNLKGKNILIGISGGVAVYKIASLVNYFIKYKANVKVIMTSAATEFVTPLTFGSLTGGGVYVDMFSDEVSRDVEHISLAKWADIFVLAPATANTISKVSLGLADNLLTTVIVALPSRTKVLIVPAMNSEMWKNKIIQKNISSLGVYKDKYIFMQPRVGVLACGDKGAGKIPSCEEIIKTVNNQL